MISLPSQFSLHDITAYVGVGLQFFLVIAFIVSGQDFVLHFSDLSFVEGVGFALLCYIAGFLIRATTDLCLAGMQRDEDQWHEPFQQLREVLCMHFLPSVAQDISRINKIWQDYERIFCRFTGRLIGLAGHSDVRPPHQLAIEAAQAFARQSLNGPYIRRLSNFRIFSRSSAVVSFLGILGIYLFVATTICKAAFLNVGFPLEAQIYQIITDPRIYCTPIFVLLGTVWTFFADQLEYMQLREMARGGTHHIYSKCLDTADARCVALALGSRWAFDDNHWS